MNLAILCAAIWVARLLAGCQSAGFIGTRGSGWPATRNLANVTGVAPPTAFQVYVKRGQP
jgi:hypothetical protein